MCVARGERLGFVRKGGYFCLIKTYVLRFNLDGLMDSLLNTGCHLTLKHNFQKKKKVKGELRIRCDNDYK